MKRMSQRGSAMLVAMILMAALLAGAAVLVSLQLGSHRSTELTRTGISSLYCAEAGLTATRAAIATNQSTWNSWLGTGNEPTYIQSPTISHDLNGDGVDDFRVTLEDNYDDIPPNTQNQNADSDGKIYIVSKCLMYDDMRREVRELISFIQLKHCYGSQRGGCGGNGNMNSAP